MVRGVRERESVRLTLVLDSAFFLWEYLVARPHKIPTTVLERERERGKQISSHLYIFISPPFVPIYPSIHLYKLTIISMNRDSH